jgi:hypothetical protein
VKVSTGPLDRFRLRAIEVTLRVAEGEARIDQRTLLARIAHTGEWPCAGDIPT